MPSQPGQEVDVPYTIIQATDMRTRTRDIMGRVKYGRERFLVKVFDEPTAVIINVEDFEKLIELCQKA